MLHVVLRALCEVMAETVEPNHVHQRPSFPGHTLLSTRPCAGRRPDPPGPAPGPRDFDLGGRGDTSDGHSYTHTQRTRIPWSRRATRATPTVTHMRTHVVRTCGVCTKPRCACWCRSVWCTNKARDEYTADMLHKHPNPSVHTRAPAHHGTRYAELHTHMRAHVVRTRGVCTKPWRVESEITRATTWHRVALTFYQPQDRDAYSMLEVESARRRCRCAHLRLHGSTPPKLMRAWSGAACTASSCNTLLLGTADEHRTHSASA